jgi:hypothetical protein
VRERRRSAGGRGCRGNLPGAGSRRRAVVTDVLAPAVIAASAGGCCYPVAVELSEVVGGGDKSPFR